MTRPDPHAVTPDVSLLGELIARAAQTGEPYAANPVPVGLHWRLEENVADGGLYAVNVSTGAVIPIGGLATRHHAGASDQPAGYSLPAGSPETRIMHLTIPAMPYDRWVHLFAQVSVTDESATGSNFYFTLYRETYQVSQATTSALPRVNVSASVSVDTFVAANTVGQCSATIMNFGGPLVIVGGIDNQLFGIQRPGPVNATLLTEDPGPPFVPWPGTWTALPIPGEA